MTAAVGRSLPACTVTPVFVGESTTDLLVDEPSHPGGGHRSFERTDLAGESWSRHIAELVGDRTYTVHPGGSVANSAAAFVAAHATPPDATFVVAERARTAAVRRPLWWPGYDIASADLTARGIRVIGHDPFPTAQTPGAVGFIARDGSVERLVVNAQRHAPLASPAGTLLVLRSDHLGLLDPSYVASFRLRAILLTDDQRAWDAAADALAGHGRRWLFGSLPQIMAFRAALGAAGPDRVEMIGTDGASPCRIWGGDQVRELPVPAVDRIVTDLGAGDAYLGGYIAGSVHDQGIEECHRHACAAAAAALRSRGSRPEPVRDLNRIFPDIGRSSPDQREGELFAVIRRSPGVTVVTGGQTGVDSIAATRAWESGLPTHVVFPAGRVREDGALRPDQAPPWGRVRLHELGSPSFRYRTWASVYLSDAVVLLDYAGGEGSAETRRAAEYLNRPLWEVRDHGSEPESIAGWVDQAGARVILAAGNRLSLLTAAGAVDDATTAVESVVAGLAAVNARCLAPAAGPVRVPAAPGPFGVPARALTWLERHGAQVGLGGRGRVVLAARDLATAFARHELSTVLTWPSLLPDDVARRADVRPLGCFTVHYGFLLGRSAGSAMTRVAVQYEAAFERQHGVATLEASESFVIEGGAETWLTEALADIAYDSFHTGATAAAFGLSHFFPTHWESLSVCSWGNDE